MARRGADARAGRGVAPARRDVHAGRIVDDLPRDRRRAQIPTEVLVRFEGIAGGSADCPASQGDRPRAVRFRRRRRAARLRRATAHLLRRAPAQVVAVGARRGQTQRARRVARAQPPGELRGSGGVPLRPVFDNPKTAVIGREQGRPVWNAMPAQVVLDYGFRVERCAPRSPEQKGRVESLVGFVKRAFFRARRVLDLDTDLSRPGSRCAAAASAIPARQSRRSASSRRDAATCLAASPRSRSGALEGAVRAVHGRRPDRRGARVSRRCHQHVRRGAVAGGAGGVAPLTRGGGPRSDHTTRRSP